MSEEVIRRFAGAGAYEVCEKCGHEGGFHILLHPALPAKARQVGMRLKCPNCGQVYDFGLVLQQAEGWH